MDSSAAGRSSPAQPSTAAAGAGDGQRPADDLGEVWNLLDSLPPPPTPAENLTATTVQMAAVTAGGSAVTRWSSQPHGPIRWLVPAVIVTAALIAGLAAGRLTAPAIDPRLLSQLPYIRHLDLLREAGSVRFLEELAAREHPAPPWLTSRQGAEAVERETEAFRGELQSLAGLLSVNDASRHDTFAATFAGLGLEERVELEKSAREFARLSSTERQALELLAATLIDPDRDELRAAALTWHRWLQAARPEDRERIITGTSEKRLEWVDWYAARMESRLRPGGFFDRPSGFRGGPRDEDDRPADPTAGPRGGSAPGRPPVGPNEPRFPPRRPGPGGGPPGGRSFGPPRPESAPPRAPGSPPDRISPEAGPPAETPAPPR